MKSGPIPTAITRPNRRWRAIAALEPWPASVWEPAAGCGVVVRAFQATGRRVEATDLVDRGYGGGCDFLAVRSLLAPAIVTNPPFHLLEEFVRHAMVLCAERAAFLLPLARLGGQGRHAEGLWALGLRRVWVSVRRTTMKRGGWDGGKGGGSPVEFGWFVWERGFAAAPEIGFFDWAEF